uniref:Uncharacterized protein n=1 Tax=Chromera velia CCMP2878 TaxID=1169474 RepID=A0A0G4FQB9_9ALVE|eukprot:Cvel_3630.t1-p1 / transcript=Cvel_3630.t1 / gene=Cvel_3630 / organism=Chromera_velia_CCMP2878 / gene_product=hypothetical protein / transcript_product=hypothetical protein / location=Cvel_scaffold149:59680-69235(-) / protein_length=70 / sequence_SO=supercontig / SO=protein_coding / is_pseudo=false
MPQEDRPTGKRARGKTEREDDEVERLSSHERLVPSSSSSSSSSSSTRVEGGDEKEMEKKPDAQFVQTHFP